MPPGADRDDNSRLLALSDGVFAISLTLLVLDIRVPAGVAALSDALVDLWPKLLSYVISFAVIGIFWMAHHRAFRDLVGHDTTLLWLNTLFLLCIGFLPFPVSLLGEYGNERLAVVVYALAMMVTSLSLIALSLYARAHPRLYAGGRLPVGQRGALARACVVPAVMTLSIVIALVNTTMAQLSWSLIFVGQRLVGRGGEQS